MNIRNIFIASSLICLTSCSSQTEYKETVSSYANGNPKLVFIYDSPNDSTTYKELQYFENGKISFEGCYKNSKKNGEFKWLFKNGNISAHQKFKDDLIIDTTHCYYESGKRKRVVYPPTKDSLQYAIEYYETGEKKIETYLYNSELIDKSWTGYYKNGTIKEYGAVNKGEKIGVWKYYDENGNLTKKADQTGESKTHFDIE